MFKILRSTSSFSIVEYLIIACVSAYRAAFSWRTLVNINQLSEYVETSFFVRVPSIGEVVLVCVLTIVWHALIRGERPSECGCCTKVTHCCPAVTGDTQTGSRWVRLMISISSWITLLKHTHIDSWVYLLTSQPGKGCGGDIFRMLISTFKTNLSVTG